MSTDRVMFTFRLSRAELDTLKGMARNAGKPVSDYLRDAAKQRIDGSMAARSQVGIHGGLPGACMIASLFTWSEAACIIETQMQ